MRLVIFSEAGFEYGFGHFYRTSGICEKALKEYGQAEMYLVADDVARDNLKREYVKFADWHESGKYESILDKESTLVVDSYHVEMDELERFQSLVRDMVVIDDNIRLDYHDMKILNPNFFGVWLDYPTDKNNTVYSGKEYTLLRDAFETSEERTTKEEASDILVSMGGTDPAGLTQKLARELRKLDPEVRLHVVCTKAYKNINETKKELSINDSIYVNADAKTVSALMKKCDFAIASAGGTTNELIKMQLPSVLVAVADNQILNTKYLSDNGCIKAIYYNGSLMKSDMEIIAEMFDYEIREAMAERLKSFESDRSGKDVICEIAFGLQ